MNKYRVQLPFARL